MLADFYHQRGLCKPRVDYLRMLWPHSDVWTLRLGEDLVYVDLVLKDLPHRVRATYGCHVSGIQLSNTRRNYANAYLSWREVLHYRAEGVHAFDWGGIITDPHSPSFGVTTYKQAFGGVPAREWTLLLTGMPLPSSRKPAPSLEEEPPGLPIPDDPVTLLI